MSDTTPNSRSTFIHEAAVYGSDDEALDLLVPFLREGVRNGWPTYLAVSDRLGKLLRHGLGRVAQRVADLEYADVQRPMSTLRANLELFEHSAARGQETRLVREVPQSGRTDWAGWVRYEVALNRIGEGFGVRTVCPYDARQTPAGVIADVKATHPALAAPRGEVRPSPAYVVPEEKFQALAREDLDPLESLPPDVELANPTETVTQHAVGESAVAARLPLPDVNALCLAAEEAVHNARRHGRGRVTLRIWRGADRVVVNVHDQGPGPPSPFVGLVDRPRQQGMSLLYQLCTRVNTTVAPDGFTVHLVSQVGVPRRG